MADLAGSLLGTGVNMLSGGLGGVVSNVLAGVGAIFDPSAAHRRALLLAAAKRGDVNFIIQWINDYPPHPNDSNQYARQVLPLAQQVAARASVSQQSVIATPVAAPPPNLTSPYAPPAPPIFTPPQPAPVMQPRVLLARVNLADGSVGAIPVFVQ